jgi:hypothetical protein
MPHRFPRRLYLLAFFGALSSPAAGWTEDLMKLPPEMRLVRGATDMGEVSENATVSSITSDQLPDAVRQDVEAKLLHYAGNLKQEGSPLVYVWDAPWFHQQGLPPNYIIDFSAIQPTASLTPAMTDPPCTGEGCLMVGYTYVTANTSWHQDFELRSAKTDFVPVESADDKNYQLVIRTVSGKTDCTNGSETTKGCLRQFTWRKFGLSIIPPG